MIAIKPEHILEPAVERLPVGRIGLTLSVIQSKSSLWKRHTTSRTKSPSMVVICEETEGQTTNMLEIHPNVSCYSKPSNSHRNLIIQCILVAIGVSETQECDRQSPFRSALLFVKGYNIHHFSTVCAPRASRYCSATPWPRDLITPNISLS